MRPAPRPLPILIAAAATALAGCGPSSEAPPPAPKTIEVRSAAQRQLFDLSEMNRAIGLKRSIQASGSRCKRVSETHYVGRYKNLDMWAATCDDTREFALFISADDSVQVRLCKDTEEVGLPSCATRAPWPNGKQPAEAADAPGGDAGGNSAA